MSSTLGDFDFVKGHSYHFPVLLNTSRILDQVLPGLSEKHHVIANLSDTARKYLASLGLPDPDTDQAIAELIWMHALAIGYSPAYLKENADGIRQDWPRIPLPADKEVLLASAELGRKVAALLDTEAPVSGVTDGAIRDELKSIAVFTRVDGKPVNPDAGDLDLTAGWGHAGKGGVTMPGKGKIRGAGGSPVKPVTGQPPVLLDIYLNDACCWRNVPAAVWNYTIGGYQVIKKWLSYREKPLLGRGLTLEEVRYVTEMARRIAALIGMTELLDTNYASVVKNSAALGSGAR